MREDEPLAFNEFLYTIKELYSSGTHEPFWNLIINSGVSLIMECECNGGVPTDESLAFTKGFFDVNLDVPQDQKI